MKRKTFILMFFCAMLLIFLAFLFFKPIKIPVEEKQSPVTGLVTNNGKPVERANATLYSLQDPSWMRRSSTDKNGFFSFDEDILYNLPYLNSEYIITAAEDVDFKINLGSVIFKAEGEPVFVEIPVSRSVMISGIIKDMNEKIYDDVYLTFRNDKHAFLSKTDSQGKFFTTILPNQKYTVYSYSPGIDNTEFIEIAEITVGDSDTKDMVVYSNVAIQFPYIRSITEESGGCYPGDKTKIEIEAVGNGIEYEWSCTGGKIIGEGSSITWVAPEGYGPYMIYVKITDSKGVTIEKSFRQTVSGGILTGSPE